MVAVRARLTAVAFAVMMISTALVVITPGAMAAGVEVQNADVRLGDNSSVPTTLLLTGTALRFNVNVSVDDCSFLGQQPAAPTAVTATIDGDGDLAAADLTIPLGRDGATKIWRGSLPQNVGANLDPGVEIANAAFPVIIAVTCPPTSPTEPTPNNGGTTSPAINIDTKAPRMEPLRTALWINASDHVEVPAGTTAAIGTQLTFLGPFAIDANLATVERDFSNIGGPARGIIPIAQPNQLHTVVESTTPATDIDGTREVLFFATDTAGNSNSNSNLAVAGQRQISIDNTRPTGTISVPTAPASESYLVRTSPDPRTANPESNRLKLNWTSSGDVAFAQVLVKQGASSPEWPVANKTVQNRIAAFDDSFTFNTPDSGRLSAPLWINLTPVDDAGNVQSATRAAVTFPHMTTTWGAGGASPTFAAGNALSDVRVALVGALPALPWANPETTPGNLFGQLVRLAGSPSTPTYWLNGGTSNNGADAAHYTALPQLNPSSTNPTATTIWRGATGYTNTTDIYLSNLSTTGHTRNYRDGFYNISLNTTGLNGNRVVYEYALRIDGDRPDLSNHNTMSTTGSATGNAGTVGARTNNTQVHGMDGNPFQVLTNATDFHVEAGTESALRNVTIQLVDAAGQVVRRTSEANSLAQVELRTLAPEGRPAYIYDFRVPPALGDTSLPANNPCNTLPQTNPSCVWWNIKVNKTWQATWFNNTVFAGWYNATLPDLPPGAYSVRVLAYDHAGLEVVKTYQTASNEAYLVAPAVKVVTPKVSTIGTQTILEADIGASQRYVTPPDNVAAKCVRDKARSSGQFDICPAARVRIYVSNANTDLAGGTLYEERTGSLSDFDAALDDSVKGFTGATDATAGNLTFDNTGVPLRYFRYTSGTPPTLPAGIVTSGALNVYVRAEAVSLDPTTGAEIIKRSTEWIRASLPNQPSIAIQQPAEEWSINVTGLSGQAKPPFNITFDRKSEPGTPVLDYAIFSINTGLNVTHAVNQTPLNSGTRAPQFIFNWTGSLNTSAGSTLPVGAYILKATVHDGDLPLGTTWRNFTILASKPAITPASPQPDPHVIPPTTGSKYTVSEQFEFDFTVNHGETNLTGLDQITFKLERGTTSSGPSILLPGEGGFNVVVRANTPLDETQPSSAFTANVTLPSASASGNQFQLTVSYDARPGTHADSSAFFDLILDKDAPTPRFDAALSLDTVYAGGTPPKNDATPYPYFIGTVEDFGSGVSSVDLRVYDITADRTIQFPAAGGFALSVGLTDTWASTAAPNARLELGPGTSLRSWSINVSAGWSSDNIPPGVINLSHQYRIDVRAKDKIGLQSGIVSSTFDFDGAAPYLGYGGNLGVASNVPSGITASKTKINWHGSGGDSLTLSVKVTDNHCIAAVRLKAVAQSTPTMTPVTARMNLVDPTKVCPNGQTAEYRLDMASQPNLTDIIGNYTVWWEAEDRAGQVTELPANFRTLKIEVVDSTPAEVRTISFDPPVGQAGGRTLVRVTAYDNLQVEKVVIQFRNTSTNALVASGNARHIETSNTTGVSTWVADTTDDIGLIMNVGEYSVNVSAWDINWNRTVANGGPTCPLGFCLGSNPPLYPVRDDGPPAVVLESPVLGATLNATPVLSFRGLHKALEIAQISVKSTLDGNATNLTAVPSAQLNFTELKSANGTRQGWTVRYTPPGPLADNATLVVNVTVAIASLSDTDQFTFRVDAAGPSVNATVSNTQTVANKTWAVRNTRVTLVANDTVSVPTILYKVNNGAETTYTAEITPSGPDGDWTLEYWARDPAGNLAAKKTLTLSLDVTGPRITVAKHGDEVLLTVTDGTGVGLNESSVTAHYRYGEASSFSSRKLDKITGNSFGTTLPGNANQTGLAYYFTAEDQLTNVGSNFSAAQPFTIRKENVTPVNLPPTVHINAPTAGTPVGSSVELKWIAEDPEEAPLTITIAIQQPSPGRVLVPGGENSGTYTINTTGFAAGPYTVVVTASDGENSASDQVTFNVEAGDTIQFRNVPPGTVQPGTQVGIAVAINPVGKTVAQAGYRLMKDGTLATSGRLTASQGLYAAAFSPTDPGAYAVVVDVTYSDGTSESKQGPTFTVPGDVNPPDDGGTPAFPMSLMALVAIAFLTAALAAYGAFGRWKK